MGEIYLATGQNDLAERELRAEIALAPGNAQALYRLGALMLNAGKVNEALSMLQRSDELTPDMPETLLALARALVAEGKLADAEVRLRKLLAIEGNTSLAESAHFQLAAILRKTGRTAEAEKETELFRQLRDARTKPALP
jgi:tetratricopeptide (TPR) repeat protein